MSAPYPDYSSYLKGLFGCRVHKITVDAGLSCPNRDGTISFGGCIYCNERGSGTGAAARGLSVAAQLEAAMPYLGRRFKAEKFIAYFQSFTNTHAPVERLAALWNEALSVEGVVGLSIGTRPDCVPDPVLDLARRLSEKCLFWMEYGLQSANDRTLSLINRGHDSRAFADAVKRTKARGIPVCAHAILGLPGETPADMAATANFLAGLGVEGVKLHLLYVVKNTPMEALFRAGEYQCLPEDEYVALAVDFIRRLPPSTIIHRLTGDPHPDELAAPSWLIGSKSRVIAKIRDSLGK
ncbi:MAG: TIGR01212 family radical SAM protein [Deltaproteobacteria bacterium]|nr:TIGR01212 family radical SAM protein [Deltaproteobacteria bacterium]